MHPRRRGRAMSASGCRASDGTPRHLSTLPGAPSAYMGHCLQWYMPPGKNLNSRPRATWLSAWHRPPAVRLRRQAGAPLVQLGTRCGARAMPRAGTPASSRRPACRRCSGAARPSRWPAQRRDAARRPPRRSGRTHPGAAAAPRAAPGSGHQAAGTTGPRCCGPAGTPPTAAAPPGRRAAGGTGTAGKGVRDCGAFVCRRHKGPGPSGYGWHLQRQHTPSGAVMCWNCHAQHELQRTACVVAVRTQLFIFSKLHTSSASHTPPSWGVMYSAWGRGEAAGTGAHNMGSGMCQHTLAASGTLQHRAAAAAGPAAQASLAPALQPSSHSCWVQHALLTLIVRPQPQLSTQALPMERAKLAERLRPQGEGCAGDASWVSTAGWVGTAAGPAALPTTGRQAAACVAVPRPPRLALTHSPAGCSCACPSR